MIQQSLRDKLGFLVDAPKQGSGNTNDGNMARKFFDNVDIVHQVTGESFNYVHELWKYAFI